MTKRRIPQTQEWVLTGITSKVQNGNNKWSGECEKVDFWDKDDVIIYLFIK